MVFSRAAHLTAFTNQQQSTAEVSVNTFTPLSYKPLCAIPILHLTYNPHVILHNMTSWWVSSGFPLAFCRPVTTTSWRLSVLKPIHLSQPGWWQMSTFVLGHSCSVLLRGLFWADRQSTAAHKARMAPPQSMALPRMVGEMAHPQ